MCFSITVGIVGSDARKFDPSSERTARKAINRTLDSYLFQYPYVTVCSGRCPLGGIDIWAEEEAGGRFLKTLIFPPKTKNWTGYKDRNIEIAEASDELVVITPKYGMDGKPCWCNHCKSEHVQNGGCWTGKYAQKLGKPVHWIVLGEDEQPDLWSLPK